MPAKSLSKRKTIKKPVKSARKVRSSKKTRSLRKGSRKNRRRVQLGGHGSVGATKQCANPDYGWFNGQAKCIEVDSNVQCVNTCVM